MGHGHISLVLARAAGRCRWVPGLLIDHLHGGAFNAQAHARARSPATAVPSWPMARRHRLGRPATLRWPHGRVWIGRWLARGWPVASPLIHLARVFSNTIENQSGARYAPHITADNSLNSNNIINHFHGWVGSGRAWFDYRWEKHRLIISVSTRLSFIYLCNSVLEKLICISISRTWVTTESNRFISLHCAS